MQALTPSLFPCYAPEDWDTVGAIADFLQRGADVRIFLEEGALSAGENLAEKAREASAPTLEVMYERMGFARP